MAETAKTCRNCQTPLVGEYCSACGQRESRADQRFMDLAGELTADLLDLDSRLWRTLFSLLFRPGHLTAEFIAGRRARYMPPLRLYLIISFILFLMISISTSDGISLEGGAEGVGEEQGVTVTIDPDDTGEEVGESASDPNEWYGDIGLADEDSPVWLKDLDSKVEGNVRKLRDNPNQLVESMVDYLPQMMFLLLPLFALLIQIAYLFSGFHYLQHLVFSLNYHSFSYLLFLIAMALEYAGMHADGWVLLALSVYMPLAFRRAYGSGWRGAIGKSLFVYFSYAILLILGFAAVAMLALLLL